MIKSKGEKMNLDELKKLEKDAEIEYKSKLNRLAHQYAISNKKFGKGQIIDSGVYRIKIDNIKVSGWSFGEPPCCVYYGFKLTKKNAPFKNQERVGIRETGKLKIIEVDHD